MVLRKRTGPKNMEYFDYVRRETFRLFSHNAKLAEVDLPIALVVSFDIYDKRKQRIE